jgi:hypothetical protein
MRCTGGLGAVGPEVRPVSSPPVIAVVRWLRLESSVRFHAMSESHVRPPPGNTEAKLLLLIALFSATWILFIFLLDRLPSAVIPTAYALPVILVGTLLLAIRLARKGASPIPSALGTIGVLFIVGGGTFDMVATVIQTPRLQGESNLVGRALLDSGHSLPFVYGYAILSETLFLTVVCTLWLSLLRHRDILVASLQGHSSFMRFLKAATGGDRLTWREWIIPLRIAELPRAYHVFWVLVIVLVAGQVDRWYLGLEWFGLVPTVRWFVIGAAVFVGLAGYFIWLRLASRRTQDAI